MSRSVKVAKPTFSMTTVIDYTYSTRVAVELHGWNCSWLTMRFEAGQTSIQLKEGLEA